MPVFGRPKKRVRKTGPSSWMHYVIQEGPLEGMIACKPPTVHVPYTSNPKLVTCPKCKREMKR